MNQHPKRFRILAIALSSKGFGFVVMEGQKALVDWGVKAVKKLDKNRQSLVKAKELIAHYQPGLVILQASEGKGSRRVPRIRALHRQIIALAGAHIFLHPVLVRPVIYPLSKTFHAQGFKAAHSCH